MKSYIKRHYKKCVVCGALRLPKSNVFLTNFPLDPDRCRLWVKASGNEDLVNLPIEKLHELKFICGSHFTQECFNEKGNRLLKHAVPTLRLPLPLADDLLSEFPLHMRSYYEKNEDFNKDIRYDNAPPPDKRKKAEPQQPSFLVTSQGTHLNYIPIIPKPSNVEPTEKEGELNYLEGVFPECPSPSHTVVPEPEPDPGPFSWQKSNPICVDKDDIFTHDLDDKIDLVDGDENKSNDLNPITNSPSKDSQNEDEGKYVSEKHFEFSCDHCLGEIIGYTCVQCENFDLCRACESRLVHPHHYVLRVPAPRPFNEIRSVIAAIRVKLKILEDSFRQQSDNWTDVVIKKEEDPLEEETTVPPAESVRDSLGESVVPNADPDISQAAEQESRLQTTSKVFQNINNLVRNSVSDVSEDVVLQQHNSHNASDISNTESDVVFIRDSSNNDVIFVQRNTSSKTDVVLLQNTSDDIVLQEDTTDSTGVVVLQQNASALNNNVMTLEQNTLDTNTEKLPEDIIFNTNVEQYRKVASNTEMFEEYLDEIWLDESVLADENKKENVPETTNVINEHEQGRRKRKRK